MGKLVRRVGEGSGCADVAGGFGGVAMLLELATGGGSECE
jgi:hypothetical protein